MLALLGGRIFTGEGWARSLLIDDAGRVAAVSAEPNPWPRARSIDLEGRTAVPGFIDAHLHLSQLALRERGLAFTGAERPEALIEAVRRGAAGSAPGAWIVGYGYDDSEWDDRPVDRAAIDEAAPGHPVFLQRKDVHSGWANSLALRQAGISESAPSPEGGRYERDLHGRMTGIVKERAREAIVRAIPRPAPAELESLLERTGSRLVRMGLTCVCTIGDQAEFGAAQRLHERGRLPLRLCQVLYREHLEESRAHGRRSGDGDDRLWFGGIKFFADGSLGSRTALLDAPFEGTEDHGVATMDPSALSAEVGSANAAGMAVAIHAIGDRALRVALDAIVAAAAHRPALTARRLYNRVEHVQLGDPDQFRRMAGCRAIASMQPAHAPADRPLADRWWGQRCRHAYAWRSLLEAGVTLAFGSDAPVESADPLEGVRAALTRQDLEGRPPGGWYPEQRLSLLEALRAYGPGAAAAVGRSESLGVLAPGAWADVSVIEGDPSEPEARVSAVYLAGTPVTEP